ncbi:MAG: carbon-nitrogen hydrolase family protein [Saprospiraceae bacterium]|nr:carbon-nitrogen hydrolase family protein [Saprospiraceae bacterium]
MKIAVVQDGPIYNNLNASIEKTCDFISDAAKENTDLIVFGENWLSGYPVWLDICKDVNLWDHDPIKQVWSDMYVNSVDILSNDLQKLQSLLRENKMHAVIGINEKVTSGKGNNTLYNSLLTINDSGEIVNHHRKLMPTYTEKLVHGLGDGKGLKSVDTPFGKLGGLICWEHWMPMARQTMHDASEDLHIGVWPFAKEMHHLASRHYAIEGRCHVVAVGQIMHKDELPTGLTISESIQLDESNLILKGGSAIYDANGQPIVAPIYNERTVIYKNLDLQSNLKERMNLSVSGHYQRPDIFKYSVNKER